MKPEEIREKQAAVLKELEDLSDGMIPWLKYYIVLSAVATVVFLVASIGHGTADLVVVFALLYWLAVALAVYQLRQTLSRLAALFLALVPCCLSLSWLAFHPGPSEVGLLLWLDGVLFPLAIGLPGWRFVVLAFRYSKLERMAS